MVPPPIQNTVAVCNQTTLLILYYISSWLVTLLEVTDATVPVSDTSILSIAMAFLTIKCKGEGAVSTGKQLPTFRSIIEPPLSGSSGLGPTD